MLRIVYDRIVFGIWRIFEYQINNSRKFESHKKEGIKINKKIGFRYAGVYDMKYKKNKISFLLMLVKDP
jgi:hypothetical protein